MVMDGVPPNDRLSELGVARISYGAIPYIRSMKLSERRRYQSFRKKGRSVLGDSVLPSA